MAPSRGRGNPRLEQGDAAALERTAQEQEDAETKRNEEYWNQVWKKLDLPDEEETEEVKVVELYYYNLEWHEAAQASGRRSEGEIGRGAKAARKKERRRRRQAKTFIKNEIETLHKKKREKMREARVRAAKRWEFWSKTRFVGDRIRMCRLKRLGKTQRFEKATAFIKNVISLI